MKDKKKVIAFDLDGTLAESKSKVDSEMADLLKQLLLKYQVCIISGGKWDQFKQQLLYSMAEFLPAGMGSDIGYWSFEECNIGNLYLMPTSGTSLWEGFKYALEPDSNIEDSWTNIFEEKLSPSEVAKILKAFYYAISSSGHVVNEVYGNQIENRGSQITFSALGQEAPTKLKSKWDPSRSKRKRIISFMNIPLSSEFEVRYGGSTSIDVTKKGRDKAYGMSRLMEHLEVQMEDILFIGDALQPGGNDYAVYHMGIESIETSGPKETKEIIKELL